MKSIATLLPILILLASCATIRDTDRDSELSGDQRTELTQIDPAISMLDHLKRVSGLNIDQRGGEVNVFLRGVSTIASDNRALFVVNGTPIGNRYADLENSVDVNDVELISVLRGSQASQLYGMRASFGAVVVTTK